MRCERTSVPTRSIIHAHPSPVCTSAANHPPTRSNRNTRATYTNTSTPLQSPHTPHCILHYTRERVAWMQERRSMKSIKSLHGMQSRAMIRPCRISCTKTPPRCARRVEGITARLESTRAVTLHIPKHTNRWGKSEGCGVVFRRRRCGSRCPECSADGLFACRCVHRCCVQATGTCTTTRRIHRSLCQLV